MDKPSSSLLVLAEAASAAESGDSNPRPLRSLFDQPTRPTSPGYKLTAKEELTRLKRRAYDKQRRKDFHQLKKRVLELEIEKRALTSSLAQVTAQCDGLILNGRGLLDSLIGFMGLVRAYGLVTAGCERCSAGMDFMTAPARQLLGPVPPAQPTPGPTDAPQLP